jgi:drug/metabolite transporter (DMT)-like permease
VAFPEERPTRERIAGLAIGFVGVLVVLGVWQGLGGGEIVGVLACLAAVCCYGIAFPYTRRHLAATGDGPIALATGQVLLGAAFLVPVVVGTATLGGGSVATPIQEHSRDGARRARIGDRIRPNTQIVQAAPWPAPSRT